MNIGGLDLQIGDEINYTQYNDKMLTNPIRKHGVIEAITNKLITVNRGKYRECINITDLACGMVVIDGMNPITVTTPEVNTPYREAVDGTNAVDFFSEFEIMEIREADRKMEERRKPKSQRTAPPVDELREIFESCNHTINALAAHYDVYWKIARRWLREAGIIEGSATGEEAESGMETDIENPTAEDYKTLTAVHNLNGTVNWAETWPIIQAELDKGRDRYEIAAEMGISKRSMRKYIERQRAGQTAKRPSVTDALRTPTFRDYRIETRKAFIEMREALSEEIILLDAFIATIDATLGEESPSDKNPV